MALILVLAALTVLTVMLTEVQDESSAEFGSALERGTPWSPSTPPRARSTYRAC
jgi:hypothetical protein